jgi:surface polysaccharide O-acyltransferase-like enzyme
LATAIILVAVTYLLPWWIHASTGLTFGAYDLAEWSSLIPAVRASSPPLLLPFLLRISLACWLLVAVFALLAASGQRLLVMAFAVLMSIALLPPLEAIAGGLVDPNYQQQFVVSLFLLLGSVVIVSGAIARWQTWLVLALAITSGLTGAAGAWGAFQSYQSFDLTVIVGPGLVLFLLGVVICGAIYTIKQTR